jgi:hypothetical protein
MLDRALAAQRQPYLAFAIRTRPDIREAIGPRMEALLAHPASSRFRFSSPAEALVDLVRGR